MKKKPLLKLKITNPRYLSLKYCLKALENVKGRALDAGCGAGVMAKEIKRLRPELEVYGVDLNHKAIKLARQNNRQVIFKTGDIYNLPFAGNYFDAVVSHHVLEHLEKPQEALAQIYRVIKKGGIIFISVPLEGNWSSIQSLLYKIPAYKALRIKYTGHIQQYNFKNFVKIFEKAGFEVIDYYWAGFVFAQTINIFYYLLAGFFNFSPSVLTENDLLEKDKSAYGRWGRAVKNYIHLLMTLESIFLSKIPMEEIHLIAKKL